MKRKRIQVCAFPGLKFETWGTHVLAFEPRPIFRENAIERLMLCSIF
jgi:hypothetical protein